MKTLNRPAAALIAALFLQATASPAQIPATATLTIVPSAPTTSRITVNDPGDHVWILQASSNLTSWTEVESWKIHNGNFHRTFGTDSDAHLFYRSVFDPARQDILSTTANALHLPSPLPNYSPPLPPHYLAPPVRNQDNTPTNNIVTDAGATLGRVLFYDKRLSANGTVSCSSCHQQQAGFSDPRAFSVGFNGGLTGRNSMGLANARYYARGHARRSSAPAHPKRRRDGDDFTHPGHAARGRTVLHQPLRQRVRHARRGHQPHLTRPRAIRPLHGCHALEV